MLLNPSAQECQQPSTPWCWPRVRVKPFPTVLSPTILEYLSCLCSACAPPNPSIAASLIKIDIRCMWLVSHNSRFWLPSINWNSLAHVRFSHFCVPLIIIKQPGGNDEQVGIDTMGRKRGQLFFLFQYLHFFNLTLFFIVFNRRFLLML